jgi:hypothetical protein
VSRRGGITVVVLAALAAIVPVAVWAGTPGSDPANGSWVGGEVLAPGSEQLVLWNLPGSGGALGTCIDAHVNGPLHGPYRLARTITDPIYGELNHLYASGSTSDVRLAELSALNSHAYDIVDKDVQWSYLVNRTGGTSVADAGDMLERATELAGPYTVRIDSPSGVRSGPRYTATVSVTSARRVPVPGARVTVSATNVHLSATQVTTDQDGRASVVFTVPAGTTTSYTLRASVQSWTNVAVYTAPGEQQMLSSAPPTTQRGARAGSIVRDRAVSIVKAATDDPARTPVAGYTYRIADAKGTVITTVTTSSTPANVGRLTIGARYTATEIARPVDGTLYIPVEPSTTFTVPDGATTWTLLARDPRIPVPSLGTQVTSERAVVGQRLSDVVTLAGNDGENGTIEATLYGPVAPPRSGGCADLSLAQYRAAAAQHVTAEVDGSRTGGNGTITVVGPVVVQPGCYGWAEQLTLRPSGATATSLPTAPHESSLVTLPALATVASMQQSTAGARAVDRIKVTGTSGGSASITGELLGPLVPRGVGCGGLDWTGAPLAGRLAAVQVTGDGDYLTAPIALPTSGCYTFVEELTWPGAPAPVRSRPGIAVETVLLRGPAAAPRPPTHAPAWHPSPTPLARTGPPIPVGRTVLGGLGLIAAGAALSILGGRRRRHG